MKLLTHCSQVVTLAGPGRARCRAEMLDLEIVPDGAVLVDRGLVLAVGRRKFIEPQAEDAEVIDLGGRVLLPGLIDAHTHAMFAGSRLDEFEMRLAGASYAEIAQKGGGILSTMRAVRAATHEQLLASTVQHLSWMRACGTVAAEVKSGYGLDLESELKMLRVAKEAGAQLGMPVSTTFLAAHAVPPEFSSPDAYLAAILKDMLPVVAREKLADAVDIFVETGYFEQRHATQLAEAATKLRLKVRLHVDQLSDGGGAALAAKLGAWTADHLEFASSSAYSALEAAGVQPVLLPASVACLGHTRYPDARGMIEAGLAVVLATDFNPGSSPCPSLPWVMHMACTQMRMTPAEALAACTINAAYAAGLPELGSIEPGKATHFTVLEADDYREIAFYAGRNACEPLVVA